jgi:hypothetical protein
VSAERKVYNNYVTLCNSVPTHRKIFVVANRFGKTKYNRFIVLTTKTHSSMPRSIYARRSLEYAFARMRDCGSTAIEAAVQAGMQKWNLVSERELHSGHFPKYVASTESPVAEPERTLCAVTEARNWQASE